MIVLPIVTSAIGVWQSYLSNVVGQRVMNDLRLALYRHLQWMPLRFFTETRTGEIQSRIANDVGGVQSVVTDTAASLLSNFATVATTVIAMLILDWRLTVLSLGLMPVFAYITYRVGKVRREVSTLTQRSMAEMSAITEESLERVGHPAQQDVRPAGGEHRALPRRVAAPRRPPGARPDDRPLVLRPDRHLLQHHAGLRLPAGRLAHHRRRHQRQHRHDRGLHDAPVAPLLPARPAAQRPGRDPGRAGAVRSHLRVPRDGPRDHRCARRGRAVAGHDARRGRVRQRLVPLPGGGRRSSRSLAEAADAEAEGRAVPSRSGPSPCRASTSTAAPGQLVALVGPSGSGKTTSTYLIPRLYDVDAGAVHDRRHRRARHPARVAGRGSSAS